MEVLEKSDFDFAEVNAVVFVEVGALDVESCPVDYFHFDLDCRFAPERIHRQDLLENRRVLQEQESVGPKHLKRLTVPDRHLLLRH